MFVLSALFHFYPLADLAEYWLTPAAGAAPPPPGAAAAGDRGAGTSSAASIADLYPSAAMHASSAAGGDRGAGASPASNAANPGAGAGGGVASISAISAPTPPCVTGGSSRVNDL